MLSGQQDRGVSSLRGNSEGAYAQGFSKTCCNALGSLKMAA